MSNFNHYSLIEVADAGEDMNGRPVLRYENGRPLDINDAENLQRLVDCWNACRMYDRPADRIAELEDQLLRSCIPTLKEIIRDIQDARSICGGDDGIACDLDRLYFHVIISIEVIDARLSALENVKRSPEAAE